MTAFFCPENEHPCGAVCPRVDNVGSGTTSHPLCCDCDGCLNGSGGLVLPGAGVVVADGNYRPVAAEFARIRGLRRRAA